MSRTHYEDDDPELDKEIGAYLKDARQPYACPHCGKDTFSYADINTLGPARSIACRECGGRASTPWSLMLRCLAIFLGPAVVASAILIVTVGDQPKSGPAGGLVAIPFVLMGVMALPMFRYWKKHVRLVKR